eukprot:1202141-Amorphochlora_amoeboformis.AAC.1
MFLGDASSIEAAISSKLANVSDFKWIINQCGWGPGQVETSPSDRQTDTYKTHTHTHTHTYTHRGREVETFVSEVSFVS